MSKSRAATESPCFCDQYRYNESRIKTLLLQKLAQPLHPEQFGVEALLTIYFDAQDKHLKEFLHIQSVLRRYFKQDPTLKFNEHDDATTMVDNLLIKLKKEREVHHIALKKERSVVEQYMQKEKEAEEEISYLKELLNEEQLEVENWKAEALAFETVIKKLKGELELVKFENEQLREIQCQHDERMNTFKNRIEVLEADKLELSKQCLERSEQVKRLALEFQNAKQSLQYQARLEVLEELQAINQAARHRTAPKKEILDRMRSNSFVNRHDISHDHKDTLTRSLSKDRHLHDEAAFTSNLLNRTISTTNPESSRLVLQEKSLQPDLAREQIFTHLFVGDVLSNEENYRYFLVCVLQQQQKAMISRSRLLYKWDHINNANMHRYIDGHPHLMILIKTEKGFYIGAYSHGAFRHRSISNQFGLLISFNNQLVFRNIKKSIVYDENEVIFGNYDLRIKAGDNKVTSNFGLPGSFYDNAGYYASTLLGEGKNREARIKHLEIFEVFFQS